MTGTQPLCSAIPDLPINSPKNAVIVVTEWDRTHKQRAHLKRFCLRRQRFFQGGTQLGNYRVWSQMLEGES